MKLRIKFLEVGQVLELIREAQAAESKQDFVHKLAIALIERSVRNFLLVRYSGARI